MLPVSENGVFDMMEVDELKGRRWILKGRLDGATGSLA